MRKLIILAVLLFVSTSVYAEIKWVDGYYTGSGQYRRGHYKDTSGDGNPYNNCQYLGC